MSLEELLSENRYLDPQTESKRLLGASRTLPKRFMKGGWMFNQVHRENNVAIYEKSLKTIVSYELIKIRKQRARSRIIDGRQVEYPEREVYPRSEDWGKLGWTFSRILDAEKAFKTICLGHQKEETLTFEGVPLNNEARIELTKLMTTSKTEIQKKLNKVIKTINSNEDHEREFKIIDSNVFVFIYNSKAYLVHESRYDYDNNRLWYDFENLSFGSDFAHILQKHFKPVDFDNLLERDLIEEFLNTEETFYFAP